MKYYCSWCGDEIKEEDGGAVADSCDRCDDFFEDNTELIYKHLNELLALNEEREPQSDEEREEAAWKSYSLSSAIMLFGGQPKPLFKDSKFLGFLPKK